MPEPSHAQLKPVGTGYPPAFVLALLDEAMALPGPCRVFGITGLQGTGKSTLAAQMAALALASGIRAVVLSIDDLYLDLPERLALGRTVHPLLATRGPPGTHDIALGQHTLDALHGGDAALPAFDKISDRRLPRAAWQTLQGPAELVLFEGWFHRVPPEADAALAAPLNALEAEEDAEGLWRGFVNAALLAYAPLWARIDRLLFLQGPGFGQVPGWRWQQEQTLAAANPGRRTMTRAEVERFVLFFERVSRRALATLPAVADRVVRVDAKRRIIDPG